MTSRSLVLRCAGTSKGTKPSKAEAAAQVQVRVRDAAGIVEFTFPDLFSSEVAQEDVEGCAFVQGLLETAASSPASLCQSMHVFLLICR